MDHLPAPSGTLPCHGLLESYPPTERARPSACLAFGTVFLSAACVVLSPRKLDCETLSGPPRPAASGQVEWVGSSCGVLGGRAGAQAGGLEGTPASDQDTHCLLHGEGEGKVPPSLGNQTPNPLL